MKKSKTFKVNLTRIIPASPEKVFANWINPRTPGNPWYEGKKLIFNPKVDGMFYWFISGTPHYGRFTKINRGSLIQHTWMSPYTEGKETFVKVTFKKKGKNTQMTLIHTGLPNTKDGKGHEDGWNFFLDGVLKHFKKKV
jgi:uncharacterized protein YndB with AHSA1/START domain